jgi:glycosyltransferase involved in cell wall biosynthesis
MSKSLLLHYPVLNTGGAEMSCLRMMKALADRGWDITLVLTTGGGALESLVDPRIDIVRLRPRAYGTRFLRARGPAARLRAVPDLAAYALMRCMGWLRMLPLLMRRYDAAAVLLHSTSPWFVTRFVRARTRLQWIRTDLGGADPQGRMAERLRRALPRIDHFVCVSATALRSLLAAVPEAQGRASVVYNIIDPASMRAALEDCADPFPPRRDGEVRIVTVGRLWDRDKAIFRLARVCQALKERGLRFRWFLVGDGPDRSGLQALIAERGLRDDLCLLGEMRNPFPAYRHADLVAVLSYHEGLCGVINEAKVSGKAVIATQVSGVDEQLIHGLNGWVVANEEAAIVEGMHRLLSDRTLLATLGNDTFPAAILDDMGKIDRIEALFQQAPSCYGT